MTLEQYKIQLVNQLHACGVPRAHWEEITEFILLGRPMGSFLTAVFSNDLMATIKKADTVNAQALQNYLNFVEACAPARCHGTLKMVQHWEANRGLIGRGLVGIGSVE